MNNQSYFFENHHEYFEQAQDFDILFCVGSGWISKLIMWFTKGSFSHVATVCVLDGVVYVMEAQSDGFRLKMPIDWSMKYNYKFIVVRKSYINGELPKMKQRRALMLGTRYDYYSFIVSFPRQKWIRFVNRFRKYKIQDYPSLSTEKVIRKVFCSESILYIFGLLKTMLSPSETLPYMLENGFEIITVTKPK